MPKLYKGGGPYHNNDSVRPFMGHQKFGFQTMLNQGSPVPLPTAPAGLSAGDLWNNGGVVTVV